MAWPFSKNSKKAKAGEQADAAAFDAEGISQVEDDAVDAQPAAEVDAVQAGEQGVEGEEDRIHDAKASDFGPFDAAQVDPASYDFSDFADGVLNLGSVIVPLPRPSEVQVEMGPQGPKMLHILTEHGRITPVAFAAPSSAGQWREATKEIAEEMRSQNLQVTIEQGPWGREVVGRADQENTGTIRIIGVDGPRWMLRMTTAAPAQSADAMAELAREVVARTFVVRGNNPVLAGNALPVTLPEPLAKHVQEEMARRAQMVAQEVQYPKETAALREAAALRDPAMQHNPAQQPAADNDASLETAAEEDPNTEK